MLLEDAPAFGKKMNLEFSMQKKYLFFDIGLIPKTNFMGSFGYVIVDEQFNILEKNEINFSSRTTNDELEKIKFEKKVFVEEYKNLHKILCAPNQTNFVHGDYIDLVYLINTCQQCNMPIFPIKEFIIKYTKITLIKA